MLTETAPGRMVQMVYEVHAGPKDGSHTERLCSGALHLDQAAMNGRGCGFRSVGDI